MKRTVFFLVLILFSTLYAERSTVTVWHSYRGSEQKALERLKENFNKEQDQYKVELLNIPYDAFANKLTNAIPRGNGPDAFIFAHERIGDWAESGIISNIDSNSVEKIRSESVGTTLNALKYDGKFWGYPLSFKSVVLFYRTDIIDKVPASTDELVSLAKSLTDTEKGKYGLAFEASSVYFSAPFIYGFEGKFCFEEGKTRKDGEACLNNPGNRRALEYVGKLLNEDKIVPQEATSALVTQLFNEGRSAMVINGPWFMGEYPV